MKKLLISFFLIAFAGGFLQAQLMYPVKSNGFAFFGGNPNDINGQRFEPDYLNGDTEIVWDFSTQTMWYFNRTEGVWEKYAGKKVNETYYVSASEGDDATAKRGYPSRAWKTIEAAIVANTTGGTIYVYAGSYVENELVVNDMKIYIELGAVVDLANNSMLIGENVQIDNRGLVMSTVELINVGTVTSRPILSGYFQRVTPGAVLISNSDVYLDDFSFQTVNSAEIVSNNAIEITCKNVTSNYTGVLNTGYVERGDGIDRCNCYAIY